MRHRKFGTHSTYKTFFGKLVKIQIEIVPFWNFDKWRSRLLDALSDLDLGILRPNQIMKFLVMFLRLLLRRIHGVTLHVFGVIRKFIAVALLWHNHSPICVLHKEIKHKRMKVKQKMLNKIKHEWNKTCYKNWIKHRHTSCVHQNTDVLLFPPPPAGRSAFRRRQSEEPTGEGEAGSFPHASLHPPRMPEPPPWDDRSGCHQEADGTTPTVCCRQWRLNLSAFSCQAFLLWQNRNDDVLSSSKWVDGLDQCSSLSDEASWSSVTISDVILSHNFWICGDTFLLSCS